MARRRPLRPQKVFGNIMVSIVLVVMAFSYYNYCWVTKYPKIFISELDFFFFVTSHLLFTMLIWSFFQTMLTDPGQIPTYWGFRVGDPESRRRRYCLMCNLFKPDRCHHCSACEKCILNMDHHCPWVNNCVGFNNRKYFLLLLVYVFITTYFYWTTTAYDAYESVLWLIDFLETYKWGNHFPLFVIFNKLLTIFLFVGIFVLSGLITMFSRFHFKLLFENKTTIENLEKKKKPFNSEWDLGRSRNFY